MVKDSEYTRSLRDDCYRQLKEKRQAAELSDELREHLTLMAAPLFAAILGPRSHGSVPHVIGQGELDNMMDAALTHAMNLWRMTGAELAPHQEKPR